MPTAWKNMPTVWKKTYIPTAWNIKTETTPACDKYKYLIKMLIALFLPGFNAVKACKKCLNMAYV